MWTVILWTKWSVVIIEKSGNHYILTTRRPIWILDKIWIGDASPFSGLLNIMTVFWKKLVSVTCSLYYVLLHFYNIKMRKTCWSYLQTDTWWQLVLL